MYNLPAHSNKKRVPPPPSCGECGLYWPSRLDYKDLRLHHWLHASTNMTPTITDIGNKLETTIVDLKFLIAKLQDSVPTPKVKFCFSWYFLAPLCCQKQDFLFIVVKG